jgi:hypothetical protein
MEKRSDRDGESGLNAHGQVLVKAKGCGEASVIRAEEARSTRGVLEVLICAVYGQQRWSALHGGFLLRA